MKTGLKLFLFFCSLFLLSPAQDKDVPTLLSSLKSAKHDSTRIGIYLSLGESISLEYPDSAYAFWETAMNIVEKNLKVGSLSSNEKKFFCLALSEILCNCGSFHLDHTENAKAMQYYERSLAIEKEYKNLPGIGATLNNIASAHLSMNNFTKAMDCYNTTRKIFEETGDQRSLAFTLLSIGYIFDNKGDIAKALEYYNRALAIQERISDKNGMSTSLNNIAVIYRNQGDAPKALEIYLRVLKIQEELHDKFGIATTLNNCGIIYKSRNNIKEAIEVYERALVIEKEVGDNKGIAHSYNNIGVAYRHDADVNGHVESYEKALDYYFKAQEIQEKLKDKRGLAGTVNNIAGVYLKQKNLTLAEKFAVQGLLLGQELGLPEKIRNSSDLLYLIYRKTGRFDLALKNYELTIRMSDSLNNEKTRKASIRSQLKYEYEKQAAADSVAHAKENEIKSAELSRQSAEIRAKKNQQVALFGGLFLVILFAAFMFNRFKVTQKQKTIIESQKSEVEQQKKLVDEKQKEVLDSIHYAKRIQLALMPSDKRVSKMIGKLKK